MDARPVLVISASGRALAASARRAGLNVVVLDQFNDLDTRQLAAASACCAGKRGFDASALKRWARAWVPPEGYRCIVVGSGLEGRPGLLESLAQFGPLAGNTPDCIARCKSPEQFFPLLDTLGIAHPEVRMTAPASTDDWLSKRVGGSGGSHVLRADAVWPRHERRYFQRHVEGAVGSVLFLADGRQAMRVGLHRLRTHELSDRTPFAYGGAVTLPDAGPDAETLDEILARLTPALGLRGVNGLDYVRARDGVRVLELNPRPTATLELNDHRLEGGLFRAHLEACAGRLPRRLLPAGMARAHAIVWSRVPMRIGVRHRWPAWVSDRPALPCVMAAGRPLCTVHAVCADSGAAEQLAQARAHAVLQELEAD